ncbi:MAG: M1 family aminopeptidase [Candidatus Sulfotelmatobacter sp.]
MKCRSLRLCFLCILCASVVNAFALDREAFTFTSYDLNVRVEPEQQRLGARGKITLRNDTQAPQKIAVLQISSSLSWRSIQAVGKQLQFVAQPYTSDIDHTGALSEAIVTLPEAVPPKGTVDLEIAYEGMIALDATRLTRLGTPETTANSTDWDQISTKFTAVGGAGNVAWYPIATEAADLSEPTSLSDVVGRLKARESTSKMHFHIEETGQGEPPQIFVSGSMCMVTLIEQMDLNHHLVADCKPMLLGPTVPILVIANYTILERPDITVRYFNGHEAAATAYAEAAEQAAPFIVEWFGAMRKKAETTELADPSASPVESGAFLLTPLAGTDSKLAGLAAVHQLTHAAISSPRPWIDEGLAHFAQALYLEHQSGRQAALDYMALHRSALGAAEREKQTTVPRSEDEVKRSLVNTTDEALYRSKAMCVWWMLRDMIGDQALKKALASYDAEQDKDPAYMQRLIQAQTQKDLRWFFDDWVYRDRGLPEFKIESAFTRKTSPGAYVLTITVDNLGAAGAEVPLTVKFPGGVVTQRLVVPSKSNSVIRVEVPKPPEEIVVNDGSVPESDTTNNVFKIEPGDAAK